MSDHNFYDEDGLYNEFTNIRANEINFNDLIETPMLLHMLPELNGKSVLDIGCGLGQHVKLFSEMGAKSVHGIDISERLLNIANEQNNGENISYQRLSISELSSIKQKFDVITSSLVFDYVADFDQLMKDIASISLHNTVFVFSMSHPIVTSYDQTYPRWTKDRNGNKLYANLYRYFDEGQKQYPWGGTEVVTYHRTVSSIINSIIRAGIQIIECQESLANEELRINHPEIFAGTIHRPDFIFFKCIKSNK